MKTIWKILITISVFVLFFFGLVGTMVLVSQSLGAVDFGDRVAVIPIKGEITTEGCGGGLFGSYECAQLEDIKAQLAGAEEDPGVKAIVLDINSGGGGVVASGLMMEAVKETSKKKPVVAYIGNIGASGAYYVASAANWTIADRNSLTGSIGVIMTLEHYYGLYEKLGINVTVIKAGESKDIGSPYRPMTEEEKEEFEGMIDRIYDDFVRNVAENRHMSFEKTKELADGTIYLGVEAKENGLIDDVGTIEDAIAKASELGEIEGEPVVEKEEPRRGISFLDLLDKTTLSDLLTKYQEI